MNHSEYFETAKEHFLAGTWNESMIRFLVTKELIAQEECDEILALKASN